MTKKRSLITRAIYAIAAGRTQSTLAFLFAFTILGAVPRICNAQQSNVQVDENGVASATSILNSTNPNGRIGGHVYNGTLSPNTTSSRFNGGGVYGPAGNVIGVDQGVSSRFSAGRTPFVSKQNYDLVALRAQIYKEREKARAEYLKSQTNLDNTPRLVTSSAPTKFPYQNFHTPRYGKTGKETLAQTNTPSKATPSEKQIPKEVDTGDMNPAQRIWMRGPAPAAAFGEPDSWEESAFDGMYDSYVQEYNLWNNAQANANAAAVSRLGGGLNLMGQIYLARKDYDNAKATYSQILSLNSESKDAYNGLALCALAVQDPDAALDYIAQGLSLDTEEGKQELYFNEIAAYEQKLDFLTARDKCRTYVEMYPTDEDGVKELKFLNTRD